MRQFYETYRNEQIVSPLVRQITLDAQHDYSQIRAKRLEEREFYLRLVIQEK